MSQYNLKKYFKTEKQKKFGTDFIKDAHEYEVWDEIEIGKEYESAQTFEIQKEDLIEFAKGAMDDNPLMTDEGAAKESIYGEIVDHPMFLTLIAFWCIGKGPNGSWIRSPGAMNPGQKIERYERFKVGEEISMKQTPVDKWKRGGHHFLTSRFDFYNQFGNLKARWWASLILPRTREDLIKYQKAEEGEDKK